MPIMVINAPDDVAVEAVRHLARIEVLAVVNTPAVPPVAATPAPRKWAGSIPATSAEAWDAHLQQMRGEWERAI